MRHYFNQKTIKKTIGLIALSFLISGAIIIINELRNPMRMAFAENKNSNLSGYAWNNNYGWISFNCSNKTCEKNRSIPCDKSSDCLIGGNDYGDCTDTCVTKNGHYEGYGVNIDKNTGNLSGYAWSPNIGWISFQEDHKNAPDKGAILSNCSDNTCANSNNCSACYNSTNGKVFGWAKILSLKENGWLRLDNPTTIHYSGVHKKSGTCELEGWAYNTTGIGWLSFNSSNPEDDKYGQNAINYAVNFNVQPQNFSITESGSGPGKGTAPSKCYIGLTWENKGDCGNGFEIWRSENSSSNFGSAPYATVDCDKNTYLDTPDKLTVGNYYYYYIENKGTCGITESTNTVGPYYPTICPVEPNGASFIAKASCDRVTLSWKDTDANHYEIWRDVDSGSGFTGTYVKISKKITDDNSPTYTYNDTDITSDYKYNYMLKAYQGTGPYCGECLTNKCGSTNCYVKTILTTNLYPCPKLPTGWKETKPE